MSNWAAFTLQGHPNLVLHHAKVGYLYLDKQYDFKLFLVEKISHNKNLSYLTPKKIVHALKTVSQVLNDYLPFAQSMSSVGALRPLSPRVVSSRSRLVGRVDFWKVCLMPIYTELVHVDYAGNWTLFRLINSDLKNHFIYFKSHSNIRRKF